MANLKTKLCGREMDTPFVLGSGPCGWDAEALAECVRNGCGAAVTKSISVGGAKNTTRHMVANFGTSLLNNEGGSDMPLTKWRDYEIKKAKDLGVKNLIASVYGYGNLEDTLKIAMTAEEAGADMLELVSGYHAFGSKFVVDVTAESDETGKCQNDDYSTGVSYLTLYNAAKKVVTEEQHKMIQRVAQRIADEIFDMSDAVEKVTVTVKKPFVPIGGIIEYTGCTITRTGKGALSDGNAVPYTGINPLIEKNKYNNV